MGKTLPVGTAYINRVFYEYRRSAKKRGIPFQLSEKEFRDLIVKNCFYCGEIPRASRTSRPREITVIPTNGIDRVDRHKAYTPANCVPCCSTCNGMKHTRSMREFLEQVGRIYGYQKHFFQTS